MVQSCSANGCKTKHNKNLNIKFHKYPKDEVLKRKWLESLNEVWFIPTKYSSICSKHFSANDYETNIWGTSILKSDAIPQPITRGLDDIYKDKMPIPTESTSNTSVNKHNTLDFDQISKNQKPEPTANTSNTSVDKCVLDFQNSNNNMKSDVTATTSTNTSNTPVGKRILVHDQFQNIKSNDCRSLEFTAPKRDLLIQINSLTIADREVILPIQSVTLNCIHNKAESIKGKYGWQSIAKFQVPYILRIINGEHLKFVSVRTAEMQLLRYYLHYLHENLFQTCVAVESFFITISEAKLLNEINLVHSNGVYGKNKFIAGKDTIVNLEDIHKFYEYLELCYNKLKCQDSPGSQEKCGFIRINSQNVVPYCVKDGEKYIPLFFLEGETEKLRPRVVKLENWNLAYVKFCCMIMGIRKEIIVNGCCEAIHFNDIKQYFVPQTKYEIFWPENLTKSSELLVNQIHPHIIQSAAWIKEPPAVVSGLGNTIPHTLTAPVLAHDMPVVMNTSQNILPTNSADSAIMPQRSISIDTMDYKVPPPPPLVRLGSNAPGTSTTVSNHNNLAQIYNTVPSHSGQLMKVYITPQQHETLSKIQPARKIQPKLVNVPSSVLLKFPQIQQYCGQFVKVQSTSYQQLNTLRNIKPVLKTKSNEIIDLLSPPTSPIPPIL